MAGAVEAIELAVLGHILNEKIVFPDHVVCPVLGSPVAYSSVCMAKLGVRVGVVTKIGGDFPQDLVQVFGKAGVNTDGISVGIHSTNNELIYDERGYKTLKYLTKAASIDLADVPESYWNADIFYVCPMDYEVSLDAVRAISHRARRMVVDLGGYGGGTSAAHPANKDGREVESLCPFFPVVKASIEDCLYIFGEEEGSEKNVGKNIIEWGSEVCVITLGERGSYVKTRAEERYIPAYPPSVRSIVDQTGAGDCYAAGYLARYVQTSDPFEAAIYATATTSYVIEKTGGVVLDRMPAREEVERRASALKRIMQE